MDGMANETLRCFSLAKEMLPTLDSLKMSLLGIFLGHSGVADSIQDCRQYHQIFYNAYRSVS